VEEKFPVASAAQRFQLAHERWLLAETEVEIKGAARESYQAIADILHAYKRPENLQSPNREMLPWAAAHILHTMLANALRGNHESCFVGNGRPQFRIEEENDIKHACRFLQAAKQGLIHEPHPYKVIAEWFGVSVSAPHKWEKTVGATDLLSDFFPQSSESDRETLIISLTLKAGARYSVAGRGSKAVTARNRKRRGSVK